MNRIFQESTTVWGCEMSEELENDFRIMLITQADDLPDGELEERVVKCVRTLDQMNKFFDSFDEAVAIPNEGNIKYEVSNDGMVVMVVETADIRDQALEFIENYS